MSRAPLLYDYAGRPVRARAQVAYDAAGWGRRARNWAPSSDSINALVEGNVDVLRRRSRDMLRRNAWGDTARKRYISNIVGTGIVPVSRSEDDDFRSSIRSLWEQWVDESDADGTSDFYGQQALIVGQVFEAGECFARLRPRFAEDGLVVPLQLQLLEPDFLQSSLNENLAGRRIRQGIEFDAIGRRVAYHFYREHPGERFRVGGRETTRVPAAEVLHVFEALRPGQLRGLPVTSPILAKLYELDQYDDAQLVRQRVAALFAFFFTKQADPSLGAEEDPNDAHALIDSIEPGTGYQLLPGEDVKFTDVPDTGGYMDFVRSQLRAIAGSLDLTFEQLTGDLTQVNYSSIRAGLLEVRRRHEQIQHGVLCFQFNRRVWTRFVSDAVLFGAVAAPRDFAANRRAYDRVKWIPQGWSWVDPEKEIKAIVLAIRAGLMTRSEAVAQYGYDAEEIDREMAADNKRADEAGLVYDSDGRQAQGQGVQPEQPELEEERRPAVAAA